jgi:hypothetical protein
MSKLLKPFSDNIFRIHTDGVILSNAVPELKIGKGLGEWKIEKNGKCVINNVNSIQWNI